MIIGVTGRIASGKSVVTKFFTELGSVAINADEIGKEVLQLQPDLNNEIRDHFGKEMYDESGLDRHKLGDHVFNHPEELKHLNKIIHPPLLKELESRILSTKRIFRNIVVEAALLLDWNIGHYFDVIILVTTEKKNQIQRLMEKHGFSYEQAESRVEAQSLLKENHPDIDFTVTNNSTESDLKIEVYRVWKEIWEKEEGQAV